MKITKDMKVGDIYLNPLMQDLWILRKGYIEDLENDNEKWVLNLVNDDYTEDFEAVKDFIKLGNIYDLLLENNQLKEKNADLTRMVCNKLITDYDYSSPLKEELNTERMKNIVLKEANKLINEENDKLKEVIEEVRECIKKHIRPEYRNGRDNEFYLELNQKELNELLQILDKARENK